MLGWEKVIFCADHMLVPLPSAVRSTGMAVLQMASELQLLWVAAGGSLSPPSLWSSLAPCPSLMITPRVIRTSLPHSLPRTLTLCLSLHCNTLCESQNFPQPDSSLHLGRGSQTRQSLFLLYF